MNPDAVDRLFTEGKKPEEIAGMLGVHEKTPFNVLSKARRREN